MSLTIRTDAGTVVCARCEIAESFATRLRGLLGRSTLEPGAGLLIRPAASVHTWGMRFAIDAVFLSPEGEVLRVAAALGPWRVAGCRGARSVLELSAGEAARWGIAPGQRLVL